jgi:23S rRNA (uracil1939-C5)-methyltransferase
VTCPHLDRCAGCPLFHLPYPAQLDAKRSRLETALGRYGALADLTVEPVRGADPPLGYRTRVKWMIGQRGELGLFSRSDDHVVVDIPGCLVIDPALGEVGTAVRSLLARADALGEAARRLSAVDLRVARPRSGPPRVLVTLVSPHGALDERAARAIAEALATTSPLVTGVAWSVTQGRTVQVLGPATTPLLGSDAEPDAIGTITVDARFGAFVQAHRGQAAALEAVVTDAVRAIERPRVLELFAGSGALTFALARAGARVDAVEAYAPAAASIACAGGDAVRAHAADATAFTVDAAGRGDRWDAVVVDPPRRGLTPELRRAIAALAPSIVVYVSCNPETLARDLDHFARLGYAPDRVTPLDMIPQTDEVEAIALLRPREPAARAVVHEGPARVVDVAPHEATSDLSSAPPAGGSGLALALAPGGSKPEASLEAIAIVKGITHKRGSLKGRARYRRLTVASGHSVLRLEGVAPARTASDLAAIGHPVIGDPKRCDAGTLRHFFEKHGLDRTAWHTDRLAVAGGPALSSPLPGDLLAVLASLGADGAAFGQESEAAAVAPITGEAPLDRPPAINSTPGSRGARERPRGAS